MADANDLTGVERSFPEDEIVVSKTDTKGRLTYANDVFIELAGYAEDELLGQQHSIVRHPAMPRCVFNLLWETIQSGNEIFAYVVNRSKNGDHYWVYAHVTPQFGDGAQVNGYHSSRRVPDREILEGTIIPLYQDLLTEETRHGGRKDGMAAAQVMLDAAIKARGYDSYEEFIHRLT